mmetsp:Transcript_3007/g.8480  ORF Transcript_3007/g.8480 Transcript_3007/m.8480 type:complete len:311 (-) Transcript_3007:100-1032(-)
MLATRCSRGHRMSRCNRRCSSSNNSNTAPCSPSTDGAGMDKLSLDGGLHDDSACLSSPSTQKSSFPRVRTTSIDWTVLDSPQQRTVEKQSCADKDGSDHASGDASGDCILYYPTKSNTSNNNNGNGKTLATDSSSSIHTAATASTQSWSGSSHHLHNSWSLHSAIQISSLPVKCLRFSDESPAVHRTFSHKDMTEKQKRKLWYRPKEYKRIRQEGFALMKEYRQQASSSSSSSTICVDGLLKNENPHALLHERHFHQTCLQKMIVSSNNNDDVIASKVSTFCQKSHYTLFITSLVASNKKKTTTMNKYIN